MPHRRQPLLEGKCMDYATLKLIHQTAAVLSICGFLARGEWRGHCRT
jgi:hypothetical protein